LAPRSQRFRVLRTRHEHRGAAHSTPRAAPQHRRRPVAHMSAYFLRRAPDRFAARKEIPARMAFCCTAAAVRPSFLATCPVGVPAFASALRVVNSRALQDAPSFGGRRAITPTPLIHPTKGRTLDNTPINVRVCTGEHSSYVGTGAHSRLAMLLTTCCRTAARS